MSAEESKPDLWLSGQTRYLSERDARSLLALLDADQGPNQALREAAAWFKEQYAGRGD